MSKHISYSIMLEKLKTWYRALPDKKRYIEFFTALLSIPVLITVILLNLGNLTANKKQETSVTPTTIVITQPAMDKEPTSTPPLSVTPNLSITTSPTPTPAECIKQVGQVSLDYPLDGQVITTDPVCLQINYKQGNYCSVVWSYRINGGNWSDYTSNSICLYNLSPGQKQLDLKVQSVASTDSVMLQRTFTIPGSTATPTPATSSAALQ